jgi:hypothetical protein
MDFKKSKTYTILAKRWTGKDMEQYFIDRNRKFIARLIKETKKH